VSRLVLLCAFVLMAATLANAAPPPPPTADEARAFIDAAEARLLKQAVETDRTKWTYETYINEDTELLAALADERQIAMTVDLAKQAARFKGLTLPPDVARRLELLRLALPLAAPADPKESEELTRIVAGLTGIYGKGKVCPKANECLTLEDLSKRLAEVRDPKELLELWSGWHAIARPMRADFTRYVALANKGARELGFADTGAMWRSKYDMAPDDYGKELDRLWEQVKPLYLSLHAYVRGKLRETYGAAVPEKGPIPAHLLGDMWAQAWGNVYPLVEPKGADPGYDLTPILAEKKLDERGMVKVGEAFFTSLGFQPLPATFWTRSLFVRPRDRDVVCHASAWDVDQENDLRIKMCIQRNAEDFAVIHHELGHNFYQRAYARQPFLFRDSANDGFHEAIGDTIALSITPGYLVKLGYLKAEPPADKDIGLLLKMALEKIAFLPFGLLIDKWRWQVFSGQIPPDRYNESWWALRRQYQGVAPGEPRSEQDFDPGAKYHVAANVPYSRYYVAHILQFQLHRALVEAAGCKQPLHRCSIYGSTEAGKKLNAMLAMGKSRPWPEALAAVTGSKQMDARAVLDYFAPLQKWLDEQNKGKPVGW